MVTRCVFGGQKVKGLRLFEKLVGMVDHGKPPNILYLERRTSGFGIGRLQLGAQGRLSDFYVGWQGRNPARKIGPKNKEGDQQDSQGQPEGQEKPSNRPSFTESRGDRAFRRALFHGFRAALPQAFFQRTTRLSRVNGG